ncbi:hypothetical protein FRC12_013979 [Ceratobasidium sp. 428]|nr:hypothetical protein FRC12_013979 [Ceratobasidium sp. 428]
MLFSTIFLAFSAASLSFATPFESRATTAPPNYTVKVDSTTKFCLILPRDAKTTIGASESSKSKMKSFCSPAGRTSDLQGELPKNFWKKVTYKTGTGKNGKKWKQLTGTLTGGWSHLNWKDGGGQYDSNGGAGSKGNPSGSVCSKDYPIYVELVEPDVKRACIRCCQDKADCPTNKDTQGCPKVIPGIY